MYSLLLLQIRLVSSGEHTKAGPDILYICKIPLYTLSISPITDMWPEWFDEVIFIWHLNIPVRTNFGLCDYHQIVTHPGTCIYPHSQRLTCTKDDKCCWNFSKYCLGRSWHKYAYGLYAADVRLGVRISMHWMPGICHCEASSKFKQVKQMQLLNFKRQEIPSFLDLHSQ